jgi:hypothetical protein
MAGITISWRSARGREARLADIRRLTFVLGHGTPHAVRLTHPQGVLTTVLKNRASQAHGLGGAVPVAAGWTPLTFGMEEDVRTLTPAGAVELPLPQLRNWTGQARYFGHQCLLL